MLKKIQNVWNYVLRSKKLSNITNVYSLKNNLKTSNAVSNSIVFFINSVKSIKLKKLAFNSKKNIKLNFHFFFIFFIFFIFFSLIFFVIF